MPKVNDTGAESTTEQLFVVGVPRSGTTYLASLLEPSRFGTPREYHFIPKYHARLRRYGDMNDFRRFRSLLADIVHERPMAQLGLEWDAERIFDEVGKPFSYARLCDTLLLRARTNSSNAWAEKTPRYVTEVQRLSSLFPRSRFIFIVRDGRDVALSLLEREWGPKNLLSCAYQWIEWNDAFEEQVVGISPERVHRLSYEALMADVKGEAEAIYDFIGEPMPEAHVRRIAEHVLGGNTNKWKSHLSERQLRRFDGLAVNALNRYGYECSPDALRPSSATLLASRIHNLFGRFLYLIKLNTLDELRIRFLGKEPFAD